MELTLDRLQRATARDETIISFAGGLPNESLFPRDPLRAAFVRATGGPALQYDWPEGDATLRAWIASRLSNRGMEIVADDVLVTNGAQQALAIVATLLLRRGDAVAIGAHSYPGALELFRDAGATFVPSGARACAFTYVMPGVANPTGRGLSSEEIDALLAGGSPIVADEAYAELRFDGALPVALAALEPSRVWHVGSFSKSLCPGLRIGYLVTPRHARDEALRVKRDTDLQAGTLTQVVLSHLLAAGDYDGWLERARRVYRARCDRLMEALHRELPASFHFRAPEGGFAVWIESDDEGDDVSLLRAAAVCGVSFDPGHLFAREPSSQIALRVSFSSAPVGSFEEGARRLRRAIEHQRARCAA